MRKITYNINSICCWLVFNWFLTISVYSQAGMEFVGLVQDGQGQVEGFAGAESKTSTLMG